MSATVSGAPELPPLVVRPHVLRGDDGVTDPIVGEHDLGSPGGRGQPSNGCPQYRMRCWPWERGMRP